MITSIISTLNYPHLRFSSVSFNSMVQGHPGKMMLMCLRNACMQPTLWGKPLLENQHPVAAQEIPTPSKILRSITLYTRVHSLNLPRTTHTQSTLSYLTCIRSTSILTSWTEKYGHGSCRAQNQKWLCWQSSATNY